MTDRLSEALASIRARIVDELDTQLRAVGETHAETVAMARRQADLEADARWASLLEQARSETQQQVDAARAAASEQARETVSAQHPASSDALALVVQGFERIRSANTLVSALNATAACAAELGEATLFVQTGADLQPWPSRAGRERALDELTLEAVTSKRAARGDAAVAVPLVMDGEVVGVLYGTGSEGAGADVFDAYDALARYSAAHLATLTLSRTAQARQWMAEGARLYATGSATDTPEETSEEDDAAAARRFARLLVSEIKLYNEGAVRVGRERRDLLQRLGEEIDRARRVYEERVPATVPSRAQHFHHELVQTLAGGDPTLLG
jgi:hypothetical protein